MDCRWDHEWDLLPASTGTAVQLYGTTVVQLYSGRLESLINVHVLHV
jgi:hypothetical protein